MKEFLQEGYPAAPALGSAVGTTHRKVWLKSNADATAC